MTRLHLIRLALVGWRQRIGDHVAEKFVKHLRRDEVHAQARRNLDFRGIVGVDHLGAKTQVNYAVEQARLGQHVDMSNRLVLGSDGVPVLAHSQALRASVFSHNHPSLNALNARCAGDLHNYAETANKGESA